MPHPPHIHDTPDMARCLLLLLRLRCDSPPAPAKACAKPRRSLIARNTLLASGMRQASHSLPSIHPAQGVSLIVMAALYHSQASHAGESSSVRVPASIMAHTSYRERAAPSAFADIVHPSSYIEIKRVAQTPCPPLNSISIVPPA